MGRQTVITRWADRIIETGSLMALVFTPYYFSLLSARHFEPDKAMVLRTLVLIMLAAWGAKALERRTIFNEQINWRAWWRAPLAIPALLYAAVFIIATLFSVTPTISWWGSYQRGQGTYTNLSYIGLFALIVGNLRSREQLQRLITTMILTGVSVSMYGMIQHYGLDPLPWKGNVITRISSTMGNSIFVAAYLIMVVPWVLYRLTVAIDTYRSIRHEPVATDRAVDWTWIGFVTLLLIGQQAFLLGILKFLGAVRPVNGDFRYWWVFPLGLVVITGTFALLSTINTVNRNKLLSSTVLVVLAAWTLFLLLSYSFSANSQSVSSAPLLHDWWLWLLLGVAAVGGYLVASLLLPRRTALVTPTFLLGQIVGYAVALILILLAIFFSQSRGPWIGGMVGVGVFVYLLLLSLIRISRMQNTPHITRRLGTALFSTIGLGVLLGGLLITFNVSRAPVFERLRDVPYIGRLGRLLETNEGTGRVRTLIWFGDDVGGGSTGLLWSHLGRTLTFGHGPETMFTVFNPFYPPELANYEARGASPDRAHQAWLDELITKGAAGLLSYFFVFGSAAWLALRQMRRAARFEAQVLAIAALAAIVAHFVEVLVGIPIVSTLTMLWVSMGVLVASGLLEGLYTLDAQAVAQATATPEGTPEAVDRAPKTGRDAGKRRSGRAVSGGRTIAGTSAASGRGGSWAYLLLLVPALVLGWYWNLRNTYADMYLNRAQSFTPRNLEEEAFGYQQLLRAVEIDPSEDYYYLQLGNSLLKMTYPYKLSSQETFDASTAPRGDQQIQDLFEQRGSDGQRVVWLLTQNSAEQMLEYARQVLERAFALNPLNKDHPANLGRLLSLWGRRANGGEERLQQSVEWFEVAHRIAPNDATILNELATTLAYLGRVVDAEARFKQSLTLDPRFAETYARLGELYRANGRLGEAAEQFVAAVERNRSILESETRQFDAVLASLKTDQQAMMTLRSGFERAKQRHDEQLQRAQAEGRQPAFDARFLTQLARVRAAAGDVAGMRAAFDEIVQAHPDNVTYRQLYTQTLSNTLQYDAALQQAEEALALAQQQQLDRQASDLQKLIDVVRPKAGG